MQGQAACAGSPAAMGVPGPGLGGQTRPVCKARRVRSARRRQLVLSLIRSRWERTVLTLMYSCAAIWASVLPRATRVMSSCSRALRRAQLRRCLRRFLVRGGEYESVLGRGLQRHRGAAFFGRADTVTCERDGCCLPGLLPPAEVFRHVGDAPRSMKTASAAHSVRASTQRPDAADRCPQISRQPVRLNRSPHHTLHRTSRRAILIHIDAHEIRQLISHATTP